MSASESQSAVVLELAEEFLERYRQGERPSLKEYIDRHPELAGEIREVFPAMALMENIALADESLAGEASRGCQPPESAPPEQLGDYRILREVGRGGMGIVYEAEQVSLGRHVALKVLPRKMFVDAAQKRRFEREARAAAKLHHTNIVPVFGVGEHEEMPYYVMQFIQGLGLDEVLDELKRMQGGGTTTGGELRVRRKDVSAADAARSLMTGAFTAGEPAALAAGFGTLHPAANAAGSPESSTSKLSDSFAISSSSVVLPVGGKGTKASYWQSVAQIGVQVADALEYAHKQGIQHRDIKPSNLLLDTHGTVWVTDFGLARSDNEDHLTQTGDIVGTLRYMPPEAFEGRSDARGDLYSLGLTLYELLALQPAFAEKDRHRLIKRVTTEEPVRLDKFKRSIPRDLVTIVHKAIDRDPARRYQTAAELTADLQHFLDDEPIQARRISSVERFGRWCRHHPGVATLTAALAVILLSVTVASLLAAARFDGLAREQAAAADNERQARREADEAKEHEAALRKQAEQAKTQAEINLQEAERQKRRAESNFAKARKAVDEYFTTVSESQLLQVSGMQPLRRDLLQSALAFYQDFLKERGDDPAIRGDLAAAFLRVAKIRAELGEVAAARKAYEQARDLYEALTKAASESVEWQHGLAQCYFGLGRNIKAIALWQKLVQPDQPRFQKELAAAYNRRAIKHVHDGRMEEALQAHQQALAIREMLVRFDPDDPIAQHALGQSLNNIGWVLNRKGRLADALPLYRRAAEHAEVAFARAPYVILHGRLLAISQANIARIERHLGRLPEALLAYQRSAEAWRKLARDNPAVPSVQSGLFRAYSNLAWYQRDELKQTEQAERTMKLARELGDRLPRGGPGDLYSLACFRALNAASLRPGNEKPTVEEQAEQKHEADLAMEALRQAIAVGFRNLAQLRQDTDLNALRSREDFKALQADLAARLAAAPADKLKANQQALAHRQKAAQADPHNKHLRADLAASQHAIALIQLDLGKPDEARKHFEQAATLREELVKEEPKNLQYQTDLARSRFALGDFYWKSGRLKEGASCWQQVLGPLEERFRDKDNAALKGQLAAMHRQIANAYAQVGLWEEAAEELESAFALQPNFPDGITWFGRAALALQLGKPDHFRRIGQDFVKLPSSSEHSHFLARLNMLAPETYADAAIAVTAASQPFGRIGTPWKRFLLGAAHYRAGHYPEAERLIRESMRPALNPRYLSHRWFWLALVCQRQGKTEEAKQWLSKGVQWMEHNDAERLPEGGPDNAHWSQALELRLLRREAEILVDGKATPEPMDLVLKRAKTYGRLDWPKKADAVFQTAVTARPNDPAVWLARGRAFAELGWKERADADFAKAASLTPDELDRFPQAGWWVIGPYPEDLQLPCPPEKGPDPSRPVAAIQQASGGRQPPVAKKQGANAPRSPDLSELHWQSAAAEPNGRVDLRPIFKADHISAYALTYVYSPDERTATLMVGGDDRVRVWLNGRLVHQTNRVLWEDFDRVPVTLKAGRNTLLCKISNETDSHYLYLRIADNPLDRARLHVQLGLWDEAAAEFARGIDRQPRPTADFHTLFCLCAQAQMVVGDAAGYRRYLDRMFARYDQASPTPPWVAFWLLRAGVLLDGAAKGARLVELAEHVLKGTQNPWDLQLAGIAHYRAGQYQQAIERLEESLKDAGWQHGGGHASELGLSLAHQRLGHTQEARQWLDKAEQWYDKAIQDALASPTATANLYSWWNWPIFVALHREAHKLILGKDLPDDPRLKQLADRMRDKLQKCDPATRDYDVALLWSPWEPRLRLARARRLAELKRNKEAAADFAKALEPLADKDESIRSEIYAELERGDLLLAQVVALHPKDDKLAAFLRAHNANARDSGPAGIVLAGNLLKNGSFEEGPELREKQMRGYRFYQVGSTELPGWIVSRGSVEVGGLSWYLPSHGSRCLDLDGAQPGGIQQTVPTKAGQKYRVVFDLAGNPYLPRTTPAVKKLRVQAAGQSADFAFDTTGRSAAALGWVCKQWEFTAAASRTTVEFLSLDKDGGVGPLLDNIALVPVSSEGKKK